MVIVETMIFNEPEDDDSSSDSSTTMYEVKLSPTFNEIKYLGLLSEYINRTYTSEISKKYEIILQGRKLKMNFLHASESSVSD